MTPTRSSSPCRGAAAMADNEQILDKRLRRAVARAKAAENIAEDTSRALYLEQQRLEEVLARETRIKRELEALLGAMEAFLHSTLQLSQIAEQLYHFIGDVVPCQGLELSVDGVEDTFSAGIVGTAISDGDPHALRIPMSIGDDGDGEVTLFSSAGWEPDLDLRTLRILISGASGAVRNAVEMDRVRKRAITDPLTGLRNRLGFNIAAQNAMSAALQGNRALSVAMIDIDFFKAVNDTYGHTAGDAVLATVAASFQQQTRSTDVVGRVGGEEFCLVLLDAGLSEAYQLAERIRRAVKGLALSADGREFSVTVSIGITAYQGEADNLDQMLARADEALYVAKTSGRDRCICAPVLA